MESGYDALGLYHDAADPRVIVPKRVAALGWTINVGRREGQLALAGIALTILAVAIWQHG